MKKFYAYMQLELFHEFLYFQIYDILLLLSGKQQHAPFTMPKHLVHPTFSPRDNSTRTLSPYKIDWRTFCLMTQLTCRGP
jgi:hypothetical protein